MRDCRMDLIHEIEESMIHILDTDAFDAVNSIITKAIANYEIMECSTEIVPVDDNNEQILKRFVATCYVDGKSKNTVEQYVRSLRSLSDMIRKDYTEIEVYDIRYYLAEIKSQRGVSNRTLENYRSYIAPFYTWMYNEEIIQRNPFEQIKSIRYNSGVNHPFSDVDIDRLRCACNTDRERALMELLISTGVRIEECINIDQYDVDIRRGSIKIRHGKGDKARMVYANDVSMRHIKKIMDGGDALFPVATGGSLSQVLDLL